MAQSTENRQFSNTVRRLMRAKNASVSVPQAGNTTLLEIETEGYEQLTVEAAVTGKLLDAFTIQVKFHPDGSYLTIASAAGDYTSPTGLLVDASGDITTQAAASSGWFILDTRGVFGVKVTASSGDAAGSTVSAYGSAQ